MSRWKIVHAVAWLHRRAGFGLHPDELDAAVASGPSSELEKLTQPPDEPRPDPWDALDLDPEQDGRRNAVVGWLQHLASSGRPYEDRRTWMLHGWLVSSMAKVTIPELMVDQIRLFMTTGGDSYPDLLKAIAVDRAMLVYLDGRTSTSEAPNENFGRELLELFALGVGNYGEDDVQAAARALTGWVVGRELPEAVFVPRRHDDTPQRLLGVDGVSDVDGVVEAIVADPEHARFVARRVALEYLGTAPDHDPDDTQRNDVIEELAGVYVDADRALDPVIVTALELGLAGATTTMAIAPIPWLIMALRATGVPTLRLGRDASARIRDMGQLPLLPPDVSGWPTGVEWFTESSLIARTNLAVAIAAATPADEPLRGSLDDGDFDLTAEQLGLPAPFSSTTAAALRKESDPVNRLALALISPENLLS